MKLLLKSQLTKSLFLSLQTSKKVDGFIQKYLDGPLYLQSQTIQNTSTKEPVPKFVKMRECFENSLGEEREF